MQDTQPTPNFEGVTRNAVCPCNSGLKFKKCHGNLPVAEEPKVREPIDVSTLSPAERAVLLKQNIDYFATQVVNFKGTKNDLKRVLVASTMHPFAERPFISPNLAEQELYNLCISINSDKLLFLHLSFEEKRVADEMKAKQAEAVAEAPKQENENGS